MWRALFALSLLVLLTGIWVVASTARMKLPWQLAISGTLLLILGGVLAVSAHRVLRTSGAPPPATRISILVVTIAAVAWNAYALATFGR